MLFKCTLFKFSILYPEPGGTWSNVYHLDVTSQDGAVLAADAIAGLEQPLYSPDVTITRAYLQRLDSPGNTIAEIGDVGTRADLTNILPDWNVVRVDWGVQGRARTARKYLRATLQAGDVLDGVIVPDVVAVVQTYADGIKALGDVVGSIDEPLQGVPVVDTRVAMRQVGWSRRTRIGFHRGYVPNS